MRKDTKANPPKSWADVGEHFMKRWRGLNGRGVANVLLTFFMLGVLANELRWAVMLWWLR